MKILSLKQTPCLQTDTVFRVSGLGSAVATICMCGMAAIAGDLAAYGHIGRFAWPPWLAGVAALFFLLFAWLSFRSWRASRRPTNWVMRLSGFDMLIKYRSYENWPLGDDDPQVIVLRRDEIAFVREAAQTRVTQGVERGSVAVNKRVDLEIGLNDLDTAALEKALAEEAARPGWGTQRNRTKYLDNPVQMVEKGVIRIAWRGGTAAVRPGIKRALDTLGRLVKVDEKQKDVIDFTASALKKLGKEEQRSKLRDLAGRDKITAVDTAKQLYGCSLADATQMVELLITDGNGS